MAAGGDAFQLDRTNANVLAVSGELGFDNAGAALHALRQALADPAVEALDLAAVSRSDSAGLACVLAVIAEQRREGRALPVLHVPEGMHALATVCAANFLLGG